MSKGEQYGYRVCVNRIYLWFVCREVILYKKVAKARQQFEKLLKQRGEQHGDNQ